MSIFYAQISENTVKMFLDYCVVISYCVKVKLRNMIRYNRFIDESIVKLRMGIFEPLIQLMT